MKLMLPLGVERRDKKTYEEVHIPLSDPVPVGIGDKRVQISSLNEVSRSSNNIPKRLMHKSLSIQGTDNV